MDYAKTEVTTKSNPLTVITPIKRGWYFANWAFLKTMALISKLKIARQLEFIHFARWQCIRSKHLPRLSIDQPIEDTDQNYFCFSTNYNGPWNQYIDTFALVPDVRHGMWWLWRFSKGFPGPIPIRNFKQYIDYHTYPIALYYDAYPQATVRDIQAALSLEEEMNAFQQSLEEQETVESFDEKYLAFTKRISNYLSSAVSHRISQRALAKSL